MAGLGRRGPGRIGWQEQNAAGGRARQWSAGKDDRANRAGEDGKGQGTRGQKAGSSEQ